MICRCVIFGGRPGYVPVRRETGDPAITLTEYVPCPDCSGSGVVSCCDAAGSAQPEPEDDDD